MQSRARGDSASTRYPAALVLGTLLVINPGIIFLVTSNWVAALLVPAAALVVVLFLFARFGYRLPTVYALNALSLVGLFAYAEAIFTYVFPDYIIEDLYDLHGGYYFNKPDLTSRIDGKEFSVSYLTNDDGFRIGYSQYTDVTYEGADWVFIGDSFTQAAQVEFEEMFTSLLYRLFPERTIANLGVSGFGLPQELALYRDLAAPLDPDVVFLQISPFNDFMNVSESRVGVSERLAHYSNFARFLLQDLLYQNPAELPLGRWTEPFYPTAEENRTFNVFYRESSEEKEADLSAFRRYLAEFADEVRRNGSELVVLLLPTKEQIHPQALIEVVEAFDLPPDQLDLDAPQRLVRELTDSLDLELIDLWEPFALSREDPFFEYDEHLSPAGHRVMAQTLAATLGASKSGVQILSNEYSGDRYPVVVGDSMLYYHSPAGGSSELFRADMNLFQPVRLTVNDVDEFHPAVSPDGRRLAFTEGDQEEGTTDVVLADRDLQTREALTPGPTEYGAIPSFDPAGSRVAYAAWSRGEDGSLTTPRIVISDLGSGSKSFVTDGTSEAWRPVFAPDGSSMAFIEMREGQFDIRLLDLSSGELEWLTQTDYDEWDPSFAPDGRSLVYAGRQSQNWDLFSYSFETGAAIQLTETRGDEWDPVVTSVEGRRAIYFAGEFGIFRGIYRLFD